MDQVTRPGQGADTKKPGQMVVEARLGVLKPRQGGLKRGLQM